MQGLAAASPHRRWEEYTPSLKVLRLRIRSPPVRGEVTTARLPRIVGADVTDPLIFRKVAAGAKTEGSDQFLVVDEPNLNLAILAGAG
jgi:hypothetical protein